MFERMLQLIKKGRSEKIAALSEIERLRAVAREVVGGPAGDGSEPPARPAFAMDEDSSGSCAPLVAQADSPLSGLNGANRWGFVCSSRERPDTAAQMRGGAELAVITGGRGE